MRVWHLCAAAAVLVGAFAVVFTVMNAPLRYILAVWCVTAFWVAAAAWANRAVRSFDRAETRPHQ